VARLERGGPVRMLKQRIGLLGLCVVVPGLLAAGLAAPTSLPGAMLPAELDANWQIGIVAAALFLVHVSLALFAWQSSLRLLGVQTSRLTTARIFSLSLLTRYLPGGLWHLGSRMAAMTYLQKDGVRVGFSLLLEQTTTLALCASLALLLGLVDAGALCWLGTRVAATDSWRLLLPGTLAVMLLLYPPHFRRLLLWAARLTRRPPVPSSRGLLIVYGLQALSLAAFVAAHIAVLKVYVDPLPTGPLTIAAAVLTATLAGFITPFVPSGLGVREAALALLFQHWLTGAELIAVTITPRVLLIASEVLFLAVAVSITPSTKKIRSS
jgi:hypothetical protein